jgi:hypothetical protein
MKANQDIADAYLEHSKTRNDDLSWVLMAMFELKYEKRWDDIWEILLIILRRDPGLDAETLAYIGAGPLEDLVCDVGAEYIERIEHEANQNRQFAKALTGVWPYRADPKVRERIAMFCRAFSDPIDATYGF